jgi:hypothetical protein
MKASDWISVKDRLPKLGEYVFIVIEMKYEHETEIEAVVDIGWLNEDGDFDMINDWNEGQQHFQVTHWQPLVLPKKEEL